MEVCANPEENYQLAEKAVEVLMRKVPYEDNSWVIAEALWDACRSDVFPDDENIECEKILREMFGGSREERISNNKNIRREINGN